MKSNGFRCEVSVRFPLILRDAGQSRVTIGSVESAETPQLTNSRSGIGCFLGLQCTG
ncbi:MAG: hypothetical protein JWM54_1398 [Acidobacteriaceae bacterium]|jgi:hypothetical protein|nr:hypothetical protein [Acidobacteriaceae bacterium]